MKQPEQDKSSEPQFSAEGIRRSRSSDMHDDQRNARDYVRRNGHRSSDFHELDADADPSDIAPTGIAKTRRGIHPLDPNHPNNVRHDH